MMYFLGFDFRYAIFQSVCICHQIDVLLVGHHADDQVWIGIFPLFLINLTANLTT